MMSERQPRRGSAFTLIHLLAILPLVGFMLGLVMWGLRAQISTDRRILVQADRQAIMRSILNQLRADLVEAERIEFEKPRADQPVQPHLLEALVARFRGPSSRPADPPEKSPSWIMRLHGPGGTVRYLLYDLRPPANDAGGGREWHIPQICLREDGEGGVREWHLAGQTLLCAPAAYAPTQAIIVRFASRLSDEAGLESYHVFETTLIARNNADALDR